MITLKRIVFAVASALLAAVATYLFFVVVTVNGVTNLHFVQVGLLMLCCLWLAWGFNMALAGILVPQKSRLTVDPVRWRSDSRTAGTSCLSHSAYSSQRWSNELRSPSCTTKTTSGGAAALR